MDDRSSIEPPHIELTDGELSTVSAAKLNSFLQLGDIKGECCDKGHKDWIEILSYSHH